MLMHARLLVSLLILTLTLPTLAQEGPFHLYKDGQPMAIITAPAELLVPPGERHVGYTTRLIPAEAPADLSRAIEEFQADLARGYGQTLPLLPTLPGQSLPETILPNRLELVVEDRTPETEDLTRLDFPSPNVMRITGGLSGVQRALFRLLEQHAGVLYLYQGSRNKIGIGAHIPEGQTLAIPREPQEWSSAFRLHRGSLMSGAQAHQPGNMHRVYYWNWEARLGAKARLASAHMRIPFPLDQYAAAEEKPDEEIFPILHGERYLPWIAPENYHHWQPRYSNPDTADEAVKNILIYLRENPHVTSVALGVNDSGGHCETERGREVETYYGWVNAVAERVAEEFPEVILTTLAYREVQEPPPFKLHPNVVTILCFDMHACMDPEVRALRERQIKEWSEVSRLGHYGYNNGDHAYKLPRIYFDILQEMHQFLHEHGAEHAWTERSYTPETEGPKMYIYYKLLEDPYVEIEPLIQEWCDAAVGPEAGKPLRAYYAFWEEFWETKAIHSPWWRGGKRNIYLPYSGFGSFMYSLEPGDMAHCRELMEQVVALANQHGSEEQQQRAASQMTYFEWYEANATAIGAEYVQANGTIADAESAIGLLRNVPAAQEAGEKSLVIPYTTSGWIAPGLVTRVRSAQMPEETRGYFSSVVTGSMALVSHHLNAENVVAELQRIRDNKQLVSDIRMLAQMLIRAAEGDETGNLAVNSSFEEEALTWEPVMEVHGTVERSQEHVFEGDYSLKCKIKHENFMAHSHVLGAELDTPYFFSARVYIPEDQPVAEGRLYIRGSVLYRRPDGVLANRNHTTNIPEVVLKPGQWNYVSCTIPGAFPDERRNRFADGVAMRIYLRSFEIGDVAYIDDVQLYPISSAE